VLPLGKVFCTMGALCAFAQALDEEPDKFLARHANGDWGDLSESDRQANEHAVGHSLRVLSAYRLRTGEKIWIITEADRSVTTFLLPEDSGFSQSLSPLPVLGRIISIGSRSSRMPQQEMFLEQLAGDRLITVLKIYDRSYAHEVFVQVDDEAKKRLAIALEITENYDPENIPDATGQYYEDFLWEELSEASLEDVRQSPQLYSFFVVTETKAGKTRDIYISADWPSAESYAQNRIANGRGSL